MLLGGGSCASGPSEIEASLESAPYTTYTTTFTILPPQPTLPVSPEFTIEKLQRLEGEATFTKSELTGSIGQTVEYEIVVRNTGNTPLQFSHFQDARCEGISGGPGEKPLQPGQVTTFTCTHRLTAPGTWTNAATIEGNEGTGKKESNEVVVKVPTIPPTPEFTIEKLQRIDETGSFTKNELTGAIGQVVNYQIIVRNTGTVTIQLSNFKDEHCEGLAGGASELAPGHSTTFTCHHTLTTVGVWTNVATVEGGGMKKESNEVVVKVPQKNEPAYTIEKLQRIEETGSFTKEELTGMIGQTVSYEIVVNNVGDVTLTFKNFVDTECEGITGGPGPSGEIKSGQSATWTCFHVLTSTGTWPNVAKIEGNLGTGPKESNKVVVNVPPEPKLVIEKRQMLPGEPAFTASELTGTIGQVVSYEIVVTNVGNVPVTLSNFTDTQCVGISGGAPELAVGDFTIYTCMHLITSTGPYVNVAAIEGTPPPGQGAPVRVESNQVVVKAVESPPGPQHRPGARSGIGQVRRRAGLADAQRRQRLQAQHVHRAGQGGGPQAGDGVPRRAQAQDLHPQDVLPPAVLQAQDQPPQARQGTPPPVGIRRAPQRRLRARESERRVRPPRLSRETPDLHGLIASRRGAGPQDRGPSPRSGSAAIRRFRSGCRLPPSATGG